MITEALEVWGMFRVEGFVHLYIEIYFFQNLMRGIIKLARWQNLFPMPKIVQEQKICVTKQTTLASLTEFSVPYYGAAE